jgi:gluconokinase
MSLLCFDISSSGISAVLLDRNLEPIRMVESRWPPAPTLPLETLTGQFNRLIKDLDVGGGGDPVAAISIGTFMHNFVLLNASDQPLTPLFTWLDSRGDDGVEYLRARLGERFHEKTGCRYHPMFPVFKLAAMRLAENALLAKAVRVVSIKSVLLHALTGLWVEDHGMASASGLYNIVEGCWDPELMSLIGIDEQRLPVVRSRTEIIGRTLSGNIPVVNGSGDGFLANVGSDCESPSKISVTLGTSGVARQTVSRPVLNASSGTFCYRAADGVYLLGCAGSNGGNVLDWGRSIFGTLKDASHSDDPPIFIPLLHGERSPDWNPQLTGSWHGLTARHTAADLLRSILEGVVFNLAHFVEIVETASGIKASDIVLSGNGFLHPLAAPTLAAVAEASVRIPERSGLASLRGSGICAIRALNAAVPPLRTTKVIPADDPKIRGRYLQYRKLRRPI